jgi:phosphoglycerate-specific signal transduction histidine kinase
LIYLRSVSYAVHQAVNALLQHLDVEVEQITQPVAAQLEVAEKLSAMDIRQSLDGLHLDNDPLLDKQIQSMAKFDRNAVIYDRQRSLPINGQPPEFASVRSGPCAV